MRPRNTYVTVATVVAGLSGLVSVGCQAGSSSVAVHPVNKSRPQSLRRAARAEVDEAEVAQLCEHDQRHRRMTLDRQFGEAPEGVLKKVVEIFGRIAGEVFKRGNKVGRRPSVVGDVTGGRLQALESDDLPAAVPVNDSQEDPAVSDDDYAFSISWGGEDPDAVNYGSLHKVVGENGAFMISLERMAHRFNKTVKRLAEAQIYPTLFPATDSQNATKEELVESCGECPGYMGVNAIIDSHYRLLQHALTRSEEWTAIFEDDAVAVESSTWNAAFRKTWRLVPKTAKLVRLQWMSVDFDNPQLVLDGFDGMSLMADFNGGTALTGAYLVRKDAIPEILERTFPCTGAIDSCFVNKLFGQPADLDRPEQNRTWAQEYVVNFEHEEVNEYACRFMGCCGHFQHGIIVQSRDNDTMISTHR